MSDNRRIKFRKGGRGRCATVGDKFPDVKVLIDDILDKINEMISNSANGVLRLDYVTLSFVRTEMVKIRNGLYEK